MAMGVPEYASLGRRIETRDGARATVRYVGSVDGQDGEWVGVEWDDPARGKHDGSHDGKRYFECKETGLEPGALPASFVRAHKIRPSVTFAAAIRAKYLDGKGEIAKVPKTRGADADADADAGDGDDGNNDGGDGNGDSDNDDDDDGDGTTRRFDDALHCFTRHCTALHCFLKHCFINEAWLHCFLLCHRCCSTLSQ